MRAMVATALKGLRANSLRFALTAASVVLGVAFVAGSFVFTDTINARFETLFTDVYAGVDATVRPDGQGAGGPNGDSFDEAVLDEVLAVDGVEAAAGGVGGFAQLIAADGSPIGGQGPPTLGFSWTDEAGLNLLRIDGGNGRAPVAADEVAIDVATAESQDLGVGDTVTIQTVNGSGEYTIVGLAGFGTEDNLAGATLTAFELTEAQRVFDLEGRYTTIDVIAADGVSAEALVDGLSASLDGDAGGSLEVVTGEQQTQEELDDITTGLGFMTNALLAFAGIALFVGAFVIQNTFRITVAQRTRELALLRALGAGRGQVTGVVLLEALIIGVLASAVGVGAGIGLAEGVKAVMDAVGIGLPDGPLTIEPRTVVVAMAVGLVVTVFSALLPARRAALVAPIQAMGEPVARTTRRSLRTRTVVGFSLSGAGAAGLAAGLAASNGTTLLMVGIGAVGLFLGASTLAPLFAAPVARVLSVPLRGISGTLARENTIRQPRRTASTASALMIGVALVALVSIVASSIKASVTDTLEQDVAAELVLSTSASLEGVSPVAVDELRSIDELSAVSPILTGTATVAGEDVNVAGVDPATIAQVYNIDATIDLAAIGDGLVVAEGVAEARGWEVGDMVAVDYGPERVSTEVVGTYDGSVLGNYLISADTFTGRVGDGPISLTLARLADGVELEPGRAAAEQALAGFPNIDVETKSETVAAAQAEVDQLVALFSGLLGLALIIALLGIANTLALSIVERTREIGLLRAVGFSRRQIRSMIRLEAVMTAVFGAIMGVAIGTAIGFGVVSSLADQGLGSFGFPGTQLVVWVVAAAVAGVVAAIGPARKAARLNMLDAIAHS